MAMEHIILVVDDQTEIAWLVAETLREDGYAVETLTDARALLARAEELRPELILLDVVMPFISLDEQLAQLHASAIVGAVPIVLVTASRLGPDLDRWRAFGVVDALAKPFDLDQLVNTVRRALNASD